MIFWFNLKVSLGFFATIRFFGIFRIFQDFSGIFLGFLWVFYEVFVDFWVFFWNLLGLFCGLFGDFSMNFWRFFVDFWGFLGIFWFYLKDSLGFFEILCDY